MTSNLEKRKKNDLQSKSRNDSSDEIIVQGPKTAIIKLLNMLGHKGKHNEKNRRPVKDPNETS